MDYNQTKSLYEKPLLSIYDMSAHKMFATSIYDVSLNVGMDKNWQEGNNFDSSEFIFF